MDHLNADRIASVLEQLQGRKLSDAEEREAGTLRAVLRVLRNRRKPLSAGDVAELRQMAYEAAFVLQAREL